MKDIILDEVKKFRNDFELDKINKVKQRAVMNNGIGRAIRDQDVVNANPNIFTIELENLGEIHDQKKSGRCWLFAALVLAEKQIAENLKIDNIKLSKSYLYFYDILERTNSFYQHIIDTADLPLTHKKVQWILWGTYLEGGYSWQQAHDLVEKYGVVPERFMPETANTEYSEMMLFIIAEKLAADAKKLREAKASARAKMKKEMLAEIYRILAINLGTPPTKFTFDYRPKKSDDNKKSKKNDKKKDKKPKLKSISATPLEFKEKLMKTHDDFVDLEFQNNRVAVDWDKLYKGDLMDPMYEHNFIWANVQMADWVKEAMVKQIKNGEPIWFAWDFGRQYSWKTGVLDAKILKHDELFEMEFGVDDKDRGLYIDDHHQGHATTIVGVHIVNGKPIRWKVKNSHGKDRDGGPDGWVIMNDNYVDKFMSSVTLRKKYLPTNIVKIFDQKPILAKYWE